MCPDYQYLNEFGYEKCEIYGECNCGEYFECDVCANNSIEGDKEQ